MSETMRAGLGPHLFVVERRDGKIISVRINKEPFEKTKSVNKKSILNKNYFQLEALADDPVDAAGTVFQKKVWAATRKIPYGETRTYAQIAKQIGHPKAVRAVGTALGKNPVCVIVPCHRVVPSSGGIGNYAYGKTMKKWLLDHEAERISQERP